MRESTLHLADLKEPMNLLADSVNGRARRKINSYEIINDDVSFSLELNQPERFYKKTKYFYYSYKTKNKQDLTVEIIDDFYQKVIDLENEIQGEINAIEEVPWDYNFFLRDKRKVELIFRITKKCNQSCYFCFADLNNVTYSFQALQNTFEAIRQLEAFSSLANYQFDIKISGGEPSIHPEFWQIVEFFSEQGITTNVQTNAVYFADEEFAKNILRFPQLRFFISFHSHIPSQYDTITASRKQFERGVKGIINILRYAQTEVIINHVFTRENTAHFRDYVRFFAETFIPVNTNLKLHVSVLSRLAAEQQEQLVRYTDVVAAINQSEDLVTQYQVPLADSISGSDCEIPLCVTAQLQNKRLLTVDLFKNMTAKSTFDRDNAKHDECNRCAYVENCPGIQKIYLEKFGSSEFHAITDMALLKPKSHVATF